MSTYNTPTRLNILIYVCSCILLIVGGFTLPVRPDTVMVGDTKVSGMTENEYINFLVKTPPFHCIIAGIILFAAGIALQLYGISEKRVVPHTDRINELAQQFNKIKPTPHVTFDIV